MDIINAIDEHIALSIRRDDLNNTIENSKRAHAYATIEGDIAFNASNYELEKGYNDSAKVEMETQKKAEKTLLRIEQLLQHSYQSYTESINSLDEGQIREASTILDVKKEDIERKVQDLQKLENWADSQGDIAFSNRDYYSERAYNSIHLDCYMKIQKTKPALYYYNAFINDLNYHADKKNSKGPVK